MFQLHQYLVLLVVLSGQSARPDTEKTLLWMTTDFCQVRVGIKYRNRHKRCNTYWPTPSAGWRLLNMAASRGADSIGRVNAWRGRVAPSMHGKNVLRLRGGRTETRTSDILRNLRRYRRSRFRVLGLVHTRLPRSRSTLTRVNLKTHLFFPGQTAFSVTENEAFQNRSPMKRIKFTRVNVDGKHFTRRFQISPFSNLPGSVCTGALDFLLKQVRIIQNYTKYLNDFFQIYA